MKSIKIDYMDDDSRAVTVVSDNDEERVLDIDDGVHSIEIDGEEFSITKTTLEAKSRSGNGVLATLLAMIGLFLCGTALGAGWWFITWILNRF